MKKIKAVNLGGWLVLERWMNEELFASNGVNGVDETAFSNQATNKVKELIRHRDTYITNKDLDWIKAQELNLVRIPIPWWLYGDDPYVRSVEKIDEITDYLDSIDLDYMLDLHTAPGCQNGFDNGGIQDVLEWPNDQKNIDKTVEVLVKIAKRYKDKKNFHSLCLLNEPGHGIKLSIVQDFYLDAYKQVREVLNDTIIVMHDAFRLDEWEDFFKENNFHNVILDTHMYQCFDHSEFEFTVEEHVNKALSRKEQLEKVSAYVPVIVGEWSLGMRPNKHLQKDMLYSMKQYASAQIKAMNACQGFVFWSYKAREQFAGWSFKDLVEQKIIDIKEYTR